jgi:hypothetical protein
MPGTAHRSPVDELTTGDATSGADGDVYQILGASGAASLDGIAAAIEAALDSFTLRGGTIA